MPSIRARPVLAVLPALAAGIIRCGGEKGPTQPAPPTKLAFVMQPSTVTAGAAITPAVQVTVQDAQGNPVTTSTASVTLAITSGTGTSGAVLGGMLTRATVSGVATFNDLTIDKAGSGYTLSATAPSLPGAASASFAVNPGAATKLAFVVQPSAAAGDQPITPAVQVAVQDALGNTVPAATDAVTVALGANPGASTLSGTLTVPATQGIATFSNLRVDRPGSGYTLAASAPRLTGATSAPFAVTLTFAAVSAGGGHTCSVTTGGAAYCWGENNDGQLGDGTTTGRTSPVLVSGGLTLAGVSAGGAHSCGVTSGGAAYCWGSNSFGELGDGTTTPRTSSVAVLGGLTFAGVSASALYHTCGVTTGGAAYCWGYNNGGQLGDGTTTDRTSPVLVSGGLTFAEVRAGGGHTCAVTTGGLTYCWGNNFSGQLGDGTTTGRTSPVLVSGGLTFAAVSAGGFAHTCGLTTAGTAYCWGRNSEGQLGDGTTMTPATSPMAVLGGRIFAAVSAAAYYHTCGVTTGGAAYCWGANGGGQLGDGTTTGRTSPVLVSGGLTLAGVSAGGGHTCGVTTGGAAYCWGYNVFGELGDGTATNRLTPVRVAP